MSFYIVPTMLYQQQQKVKQSKSKKNPSRRSSKGSISITPDTTSRSSKSHSRVSFTELDEHSLAEETEVLSQNESIGNPVRTEHRSESLSGGMMSLRSVKSILDESSAKSAHPGSEYENLLVHPLNPSKTVYDFVPFFDLELLNSEEGLTGVFYKPKFLSLRFQAFLESLSDHQVSDPINFATIRFHSLRKFINRHKPSLTESFDDESLENSDQHHHEALISFELLRCRDFLRKIIIQEFGREDWYPSEEIIQSNVTNYIRYLLILPQATENEIMSFDENLKQHYNFKRFFSAMAIKLNSSRKGEFMNEMSVADQSQQALITAAIKITNEFNLLECYLFHIMVKLTNGFLIDYRLTKYLYGLHKLNIKLEKKESLKVLIFNRKYSRQYSWFLAVTLPFLRIIETNVCCDQYLADEGALNPSILPEKYQESSKYLKSSDEKLWREFFSKLNLGTFEEFVNKTSKDLASLQTEDAASNQPKMSQSEHNRPILKPCNFEYYTKPLTFLASESFHVIQSRDLSYQLTTHNYKVVLRQLHRLLKIGGILELPLFRSGDASNGSIPQGSVTTFPNPSTFMGLEIKDNLSLIPQFLEVLLQELSTLFGPKNIKFSSSMLSNHQNVNNFLIHWTALSVYEMFGQIDKLCEQFNKFEEEHKVCCHYYFYIQAEKV